MPNPLLGEVSSKEFLLNVLSEGLNSSMELTLFPSCLPPTMRMLPLCKRQVANLERLKGIVAEVSQVFVLREYFSMVFYAFSVKPPRI